MELALVRLGASHEEFYAMSPVELAQRLRAARLRRNDELKREAWRISWLVSPHVGKKDQHKVRPFAVLMTAPGFDPDDDEMQTLIDPAPAHGSAPTVGTNHPNVGVDAFNAVFDRIDAARKDTHG